MTTPARGTEKAPEKAPGGAGSAHPVKPPELDQPPERRQADGYRARAEAPAIARRGGAALSRGSFCHAPRLVPGCVGSRLDR